MRENENSDVQTIKHWSGGENEWACTASFKHELAVSSLHFVVSQLSLFLIVEHVRSLS